ncbi:MAG: ABC transporter substrate-binding protein, partial [Betaproteobacteria bacterium]
ALLETSKSMVDGKLITKPLTWGEVKGAFAMATAPVKAAYDKTGGKPDMAAFEAKNTQDLRGMPIWAMDRWAERS